MGFADADSRRSTHADGKTNAAYMLHRSRIGRLSESLQQSGELDTTLIVYSVGDNAPAAEEAWTGLSTGLLAGRQRRGSGSTKSAARPANHTSRSGWGLAMDPLSSGSSRSPATLRYPQRHGHSLAEGHQAKGELRSQFHHVIDVVPTILEATGIPAPSPSTAFLRSRSKACQCSTRSTTPRPRIDARRSTSKW